MNDQPKGLNTSDAVLRRLVMGAGLVRPPSHDVSGQLVPGSPANESSVSQDVAATGAEEAATSPSPAATFADGFDAVAQPSADIPIKPHYGARFTLDDAVLALVGADPGTSSARPELSNDTVTNQESVATSFFERESRAAGVAFDGGPQPAEDLETAIAKFLTPDRGDGPDDPLAGLVPATSPQDGTDDSFVSLSATTTGAAGDDDDPFGFILRSDPSFAPDVHPEVSPTPDFAGSQPGGDAEGSVTQVDKPDDERTSGEPQDGSPSPQHGDQLGWENERVAPRAYEPGVGLATVEPPGGSPLPQHGDEFWREDEGQSPQSDEPGTGWPPGEHQGERQYPDLGDEFPGEGGARMHTPPEDPQPGELWPEFPNTAAQDNGAGEVGLSFPDGMAPEADGGRPAAADGSKTAAIGSNHGLVSPADGPVPVNPAAEPVADAWDRLEVSRPAPKMPSRTKFSTGIIIGSSLIVIAVVAFGAAHYIHAQHPAKARTVADMVHAAPPKPSPDVVAPQGKVVAHSQVNANAEKAPAPPPALASHPADNSAKHPRQAEPNVADQPVGAGVAPTEKQVSASVGSASTAAAKPVSAPAQSAAAERANTKLVAEIEKLQREVRKLKSGVDTELGSLHMQVDTLQRQTQANEAEINSQLFTLSGKVHSIEHMRVAAVPPAQPLPKKSTSGLSVLPGYNLLGASKTAAVVSTPNGTFTIALGNEIRGAGIAKGFKVWKGTYELVTSEGLIRPAAP